MKFNEAKGKVLHLDWGNSKHRYRLGGEWIVNGSGEKNLRVLMLNMTWQCVLTIT